MFFCYRFLPARLLCILLGCIALLGLANTVDAIDAPTNLRLVTTYSNRIDIAWDAVPLATGYRVEYSTNATSGWFQIGTPTGPAYSQTSSLYPNTTYYYRVRAVEGANLSLYSSTLQVKTLFGAQSLTAKGEDGKIKLTWTDIYQSTGYVLKRKAPGESTFSDLVTRPSGTSSYDDLTVTNGQTYEYIMAVQNSAGTGDFSTPASATPALPGIEAITFEPGGQVGGANVTGRVALKYALRTASLTVNLAYSSNLTGPSSITIPINAQSETFTVGTAGTETFLLESVTGSATTSADIVGRLTLFPLPKPFISATPVAATAILVAWNQVRGATTYRVERKKTGETTWTLAGETAQLSLTDSPLLRATEYRYRVKAQLTNALGAFSDEVVATTLGANPALIAPASVLALDELGIVSVRWQSIRGATYRVLRATDALGPYVEVASGLNDTEFRDSSVTPGNTYYYQVGAVRDSTNGPLSTEVSVLVRGDAGRNPSSGVIPWNGLLIGTNYHGGRNGLGTLWSYSSVNGLYEKISFGPTNSLGLGNPAGSLAVNGNYLYGLFAGIPGMPGNALYRTNINTSPNSDFSFTVAPGASALADGGDGNLYGAAYGGGLNSTGSIFKVSSAGVITTIYSLDDPGELGINATGTGPYKALTLGPDGCLYGVTESGGTYGMGVLFKITLGGTYTVVHHFERDDITNTLPNGYDPVGPVAIKSGYAYIAFRFGGDYAAGTVLKVDLSTSATQVVSLPAPDSSGVSTTGSSPSSRLVDGGDGNLYLYTAEGGQYGGGTILRVSTSLVLTSIWSFKLDTGLEPIEELLLGTDGLLYGTVRKGGLHGGGAFFRISTSGTWNTLSDFYGGGK